MEEIVLWGLVVKRWLEGSFHFRRLFKNWGGFSNLEDTMKLLPQNGAKFRYWPHSGAILGEKFCGQNSKIVHRASQSVYLAYASVPIIFLTTEWVPIAKPRRSNKQNRENCKNHVLTTQWPHFGGELCGQNSKIVHRASQSDYLAYASVPIIFPTTERVPLAKPRSPQRSTSPFASEHQTKKDLLRRLLSGRLFWWQISTNIHVKEYPFNLL